MNLSLACYPFSTEVVPLAHVLPGACNSASVTWPGVTFFIIPHCRAGVSKQGETLSTPGAVTSEKGHCSEFRSYQLEHFCP